MSRDIYLIGYGVGRALATACPNSVKESKLKSNLGELAGKKLTAVRKNPRKEDIYITTESWALGFWEGFMDRAEDMK